MQSLSSLLDSIESAVAVGVVGPASGSVWLLIAAAALLALAGAAFGSWIATRQRRDLHAFRALAAEALQQNNEGFLSLASERLRALQEAGGVDLDGRHKAIEDLVAPLHDAIDRFQQETRELERARLTQAGRVAAASSTKAARTAEGYAREKLGPSIAKGVDRVKQLRGRARHGDVPPDDQTAEGGGEDEAPSDDPSDDQKPGDDPKGP